MRKMTSHKAYYRSRRNSGRITTAQYTEASKYFRLLLGVQKRAIEKMEQRMEKTHD